MHGIAPRLKRYSLLLAAAATLTLGAQQNLSAQTTDDPLNYVAQSGYAQFLAKIRLGKTVKVAFLGGSTTVGSTTIPRLDPNGNYDFTSYNREQDSWRAQVMQGLRNAFESYPKQIKMVNAGLSGTGSMAGAFRYASDVGIHDPDLLFIEFSINDRPLVGISTTPSADCSIQRSLLSIIEQARAQNPNVAILMAISPTKRILNDPTSPAAISRAMTRDAAISFGVPYTDVTLDFFVNPLPPGIHASQMYAGDLSEHGNATHPSPTGHTIYAGAVLKTLSGVFRTRRFGFPAPRIPISANLEPFPLDPITIAPSDMPLTAGFHQNTNLENWTRHPLFTGKDALFAQEPKTEFALTFQGSSAAIWWEWDYLDQTIHGRFELLLDGQTLGIFSSHPDFSLGEQRLPHFQVVAESIDPLVSHSLIIRIPKEQPTAIPGVLNLAMIGFYVDQG